MSYNDLSEFKVISTEDLKSICSEKYKNDIAMRTVMVIYRPRF